MTVRILEGDALDILRTLPAESIHCCVTSPPYWGLRDYGVDSQMGLEQTPKEYVAKMVAVFAGVRRVLRDDGTLWLNIGDCYSGSGKGGNPQDSPHQKQRTNKGSIIGQTARDAARTMRAGMDRTCGLKPKDLVGIPWMLAFALRADGWHLRSEITWCKGSPMPESTRDRPTSATEKIFLLTKSPAYFYDQDAERRPLAEATKQREKYSRNSGKSEPYAVSHNHESTSNQSGGNLWNWWQINSVAFKEAHFATFPPAIPERCIKLGTAAPGCCPKCQSPWCRSDAKENKWNHGWMPGCKCHSGDPIPCTILDPFGGAGTTGLVADRLGRDAVLIELNPKYADMARRRIASDAGMFADVV